MNRKRTIQCVVALAIPFVGLMSGCFQPAPPATAVLAGTWAVSVQNAPDLKELLLTFDSNGNLTTISYQIGTNTTVTVPSAVGATSVNGKDVNISTSFSGNSLAFTGTLNDADTEITGNLTTTISVGSLVVTVNNGPATLTKQ